MKAEGIEYDQRMEELEKLEHPKPNREFVYSRWEPKAATQNCNLPSSTPATPSHLCACVSRLVVSS
jgi:hypothetical protein